MPSVPEPVGSPEELKFLRWVRDTLLGVVRDVELKAQADYNANSAQNGTMTMLVNRLGDVNASIGVAVSSATFDASRVVSGTFATARIPNISASIITSGTLNIPGNITTAGHIYVPNSTIASFGSWTVAYIDGDGRLTRGASSARFKVDIHKAPGGKNYFSVEHKEFAMKGGNGWKVLGYIAEDLMGTDMERFVVFERDPKTNSLLLDEDGNVIPLSIDFIPMLMAQTEQLKRELDDTNARLASIEARLANLEN